MGGFAKGFWQAVRQAEVRSLQSVRRGSEVSEEGEGEEGKTHRTS